MRFCTSLGKLSWRVKYIGLLLFSLSVLAWISTFSKDSQKYFQFSPYVTQTHVKDDSQRNNLTSETVASDGISTQARTTRKHNECPLESPFLQGAIKLSFEPSLSMKDIKIENKDVTEGGYEPPDCIARQTVAILIPYRQRERHLLYLLHHLHPFLQRQQLHYAIYVIHQAGDTIFNRAKLLNIGYLEALKDYNWDCFIFHDVDLIPENDHNLYVCEDQPKHLVVGRNSTGYKLLYNGYFGGVTALSKEQFLKVNGFPNSYWGWGGEDDDLRIRVTLQKMLITRPSAQVARYTMVFHKRDAGNEKNNRRMKLLANTKTTWKEDGLNSCSYKTLSIERHPLYVNVTVDIGKPES